MFRINRKELTKELALLVPIAGAKSVIPALSTVRLSVQAGKVALLVSSADVALLTEVPVEGENWQGCIPARQLYDLTRFSSCEEVVFTPQGNCVQIGLGRSRHRLPAIAFSAFPAVQEPVISKDLVTVKGDDFKPAIERVLPCVSRGDSSAFNLKGVKLEAKDGELKLVGTNTHRLGVATIPAEGQIDILIPNAAADLLSRLEAESISLWHSENQAAIQFGHRMLIARLPVGEFPNWRIFMPKDLPIKATVDTREWIGALKRADVTRDITFQIGVGRVLLGVVFVFGKDELVIDTKHSDQGRSEEPVPIRSNMNGNLIYMGINPDYVMDFLKLAGAKTDVEFKDGKNVLKLTDGSSFEYVVVPQSLRAEK